MAACDGHGVAGVGGGGHGKSRYPFGEAGRGGGQLLEDAEGLKQADGVAAASPLSDFSEGLGLSGTDAVKRALAAVASWTKRALREGSVRRSGEGP